MRAFAGLKATLTTLLAITALSLCCPAWASASLYQRMGGRPVVDAVVKDLLAHTLADPLLAPYFADSNMRRVREKLDEQICQLGGGGCKYTGDTMREVHAEHHITQAAFYRLVELLRDALRRQHVQLRERNELLALLAPMEPDVVNVPAPKPQPAATVSAATGP